MGMALGIIGIIGMAATAVGLRSADQQRAFEANHRMGLTVIGVLYATFVFLTGFITAALLIAILLKRV